MTKRSSGWVNFEKRIPVFLEELIIFLLILSPILNIIFFKIFNFPKGTLFYVLMVPLTLISLTLLWGVFTGTCTVVIKQHVSDLKGLKKKFRIVFFADLHVAPFRRKKFVERVVEKINNLRADLIFLGGDFISGKDDDIKYLTPLGKLEANFPIVAVLGNHDYGIGTSFDTPNEDLAKKVARKLRSLGIKVLRNTNLKVNFDKETLYIVGIDDLWAGHDNIEKAFKGINVRRPIIVLVHNLDLVKKLRGKKVEILLAGHTHGRFVRVPFSGEILPPLENTQLESKYVEGFHKFGRIPMFVTSGLGESFTRIRIFDPPEIIICDLK